MATFTQTLRTRIVRLASVVLLAAVGVVACADDDKPSKGEPVPGATETNVAPAPCKGDGDCPPGIACVQFDADAGADAVGFCDVDEMVEPSGGPPVTSAAPAPCRADDDCPAEIACVLPSGPGSVGFCDVEEMLAPSP